jgi:hypothetical protein
MFMIMLVIESIIIIRAIPGPVKPSPTLDTLSQRHREDLSVDRRIPGG